MIGQGENVGDSGGVIADGADRAAAQPHLSAAAMKVASTMPASTAALKNGSRWSLTNGRPRHWNNRRWRRLLAQNTRKMGAALTHGLSGSNASLLAPAAVAHDHDIGLLQVALGGAESATAQSVSSSAGSTGLSV